MKMSTLLNKKTFAPVASLLYSLFRYALLICVSYVVLFPVIKMISTAFAMPEDVFSGASGTLPDNPTFQNFSRFKLFFPYKKLFSTTVQISVFSTILQLISCSLVGYGLGRYKFKGSGLVYAAVLFTVILPVQITLIPAYYGYRWFDFFGIGKLIGLFTGKAVTVNLLKDFMAVYTPALFGVGLRSGIYIFLFRQFFASMPKDLEEAAVIDGCGPFRTFLRVMIPNIKPVVVTVALLSVIYYWNDSLVTDMMILQEDGQTLMQGIAGLKKGVQNTGTKDSDLAQIICQQYAAMLASVAPLMIAFTVAQKFFVECMDRSGSKG